MKTTALCTLLACLLLFAAPLTSHADDKDDGKLIDVTFKDTPVRKAITKLADMAGANIIMSPKVKGSVTVQLQGVAWREALDMIAQSTGSVVIEEDFGILRVVPAAEAKPSSAKRELERAAELAHAHARLAELEAKLAKARAEKHGDEVQLLAEQLARLRADIAESRARAARAAAVRAPGTAQITEHGVTIYDTRDLGEEQLKQILLKFRKKTTDIRFTNGQLIVRTGPATQKELAKALEQARKRQAAAKEDIVVDFGKPITTRESVRLRGQLGPDGRIVFVKEKTGDDGDKLDTVTLDGKRVFLSRVQTDAQLAAARKRIAELSQALTHLRAAGAEADAKRLHGTIAKAKAALAAAVKAREEAEQRRQRVVPYMSAVPLLGRKSASGDAGLQHSIQALRKDVNGLRREVRQLTGLVRKLLEQRER
jgi:hypothetical protein